jgi:4a-hydroxytetrahydrobiopterin dehydratase
MADVLSEAEVDAAVTERGLGWEQVDGMLVKVARRGDFAGALDYVNRVGALAEAADHHPDIDLRWDTVTLRLVTHSDGGITTKDVALAADIDRLDDARG